MSNLNLLLPLVTMNQAASYEARASWLPAWLPTKWVQAWCGRKYRRYLRSLNPADRIFLITLNQKLRPTPCTPPPAP